MEDSGGPEKDLQIIYSSGPEKKTIGSSSSSSVWRQLTVGEAEAETGLVAADVLAVKC